MEIWTSRDPSTHPSIMFRFLIYNVKLVSMKYLTSFMMQASYFVSQGFRRRDERSNMLLVCEDACCYNCVLLTPVLVLLPLFAVKYVAS